MRERDNRLYECVFIVRPDLAPPQVEVITAKMSEILTSRNCRIEKTEFCGLLKLAYPILKNKNGHYVILGIRGNGEAITEMERIMRIDQDVIRYLTVKVDSMAPGATMISYTKNNYKRRKMEEDDLDLRFEGEEEIVEDKAIATGDSSEGSSEEPSETSEAKQLDSNSESEENKES
jgi:small subunit ribosomal protein S6